MKFLLFLASVSVALAQNVPFNCSLGTTLDSSKYSNTNVTQDNCCETRPASCEFPKSDSELRFVCDGDLVPNIYSGSGAPTTSTCCKKKTCKDYTYDATLKSFSPTQCTTSTILSNENLLSENITACCVAPTCEKATSSWDSTYQTSYAERHVCPPDTEYNSTNRLLSPSDTNCCKPSVATCLNAPGAPALTIPMQGVYNPFVCNASTVFDTGSLEKSPNQTMCCKTPTCKTATGSLLEIAKDTAWHVCLSGTVNKRSGADNLPATAANCCVPATCANTGFNQDTKELMKHACPPTMIYNETVTPGSPPQSYPPSFAVDTKVATDANCCMTFVATCSNNNKAGHTYACALGSIYQSANDTMPATEANCCSTAKMCGAVRQKTCVDFSAESFFCSGESVVGDPAKNSKAVSVYDDKICCMAAPTPAPTTVAVFSGASTLEMGLNVAVITITPLLLL